MNSNYLLIHSKDVKAKIQRTYETKTQNHLFYDPSLSHKGDQGVNLTGYLDSSHMVSQYLLIHSKALKATIKEIKAKTQNQLFYDLSLTHKGGSGGIKLTGYLDSPYMLSQYLLIHSEAIKATIKEI